MTFHGRLAKMGSSKNSLDTISEVLRKPTLIEVVAVALVDYLQPF
jgi:hypothetical protein